MCKERYCKSQNLKDKKVFFFLCAATRKGKRGKNAEKEFPEIGKFPLPN
jgi:hypothetical protein